VTPAGLQHRLGRSQRLRKRSSFLLVQQHGHRIAGRTLVLYAMSRRDGMATPAGRLGITVGRRVGNAVIRNRIKRWLRESYRRLASRPDVDIVAIAKPTAANSTFQATSLELRSLLGRVPGR
jgi:ribonuclease P protein component